MTSSSPIGVFDSGLGGLTVLKEIVRLLPEYDFVYLGDNKRAPYGPRDFETVYHYTLEAVNWLFDKGCPLVILACNTASAKALRTIQQKDLPRIDPTKRVLGVIRPTTEVIGDYTETNHIGILGTKGTIDSASYVIEIQKSFPDVTVYQQACPAWVDLVESGEHLNAKADQPVQDCLHGLLNQCEGIDTILLGCTHYPLLLPKIREFINPAIQLVSQGEIVAESLVAYLRRHPEMEKKLSRGGKINFFTTGDTTTFGRAAGAFWGEEVPAQSATL